MRRDVCVRMQIVARTLLIFLSMACPAWSEDIPGLYSGMGLAEVRDTVTRAGWRLPTGSYCLRQKAHGSHDCGVDLPSAVYGRAPEIFGMPTDLPILGLCYNGEAGHSLNASFGYEQKYLMLHGAKAADRFVASLKLVGWRIDKYQCNSK